MNLKLFNQLQGSATSTIILRPGRPGSVQFFLISASVNYSIVVSGECAGDLPDSTPRSFDIVLSSIAPLLDKGYEFRVDYSGGALRFVEEMERFTVAPLCVEHVADTSLDVMRRFLEFSSRLDSQLSVSSKLEEAELKLAQLKASYKQSKITELSSPTSDPFGDPADLDDTRVDKYYRPLIEEAEKELDALKDAAPSSPLEAVNLGDLRRIAAVAARFNTTVALCDDYAIASVDSVFVVQKIKCGVRAIQGKLLQRLLNEKDAVLYQDGDDLVFNVVSGKGKDRTTTTLFLQSYLPNISADSSIVTKGSVQEKYTLNLRGLLPVINAVSSKFDTMEFDMGAACVRLSNDRGEVLQHGFDVEDAKTVELNKLMRGEVAGDVVMSTISIPRTVQRILPFFREDFTVYVKSKKIVLQSESLYAVFGR